MTVFINIVSTFIVLMGALWALLPGGFGVHNFNASHSPPLTYLATTTWWFLMTSHPFVLYKIWAGHIHSYWWLLLPLVLHIVFFTIFGRDVGTG